VANHTAWDHPWTVTHPERFTVGPDGGFIPPNPGWADVIDLHFDDPGTRAAMTEAMEYWVREFDIDGYRCDVADDVPHDFWESSIEAIRTIRPVFMLAEADAPSLHGVGFEASYGWGLGGTLMRIAKGEAEAAAVRRHVERDAAKLEGTPGAFRMHFTTNHDWNSWEGTAIERLGPMWEAATVLTFTLPGMPLIYSGQEAGLDTMLEFFEKDEIAWREHPARALYTKLTRLKREQSALRHGADAGAIEFLDAGDPKRIVAFRRIARESEVVVFANLSSIRAQIVAPAQLRARAWVDLDGQAAALPESLGAWEWRILWRKP
jgi:glycosidase